MQFHALHQVARELARGRTPSTDQLTELSETERAAVHSLQQRLRRLGGPVLTATEGGWWIVPPEPHLAGWWTLPPEPRLAR